MHTTRTYIRYSDNQAIQAVKAALSKPKSPSYRLVECEFPPLAALNKLGDGSLQSALKVDEANLAFASKLANGVSPLPLLGPKAWLVLSSSATSSFAQKAVKTYGRVHSLKNGLPNCGKNDVCVLVAPSGRDYSMAQQLARSGSAVVLVNGFAKVSKCQSLQTTPLCLQHSTLSVSSHTLTHAHMHARTHTNSPFLSKGQQERLGRGYHGVFSQAIDVQLQCGGLSGQSISKPMDHH